MNEDEQIKGQLSMWDLMSQEVEPTEVPIKGAINVKATPIGPFEVSLATGDLVLIVSMIEDYVRSLDEIKGDDDVMWTAYYRRKFKEISERIQQGIEYDYEKAREKCLKKQEKEDNSDIGGDAFALAVKAQLREAARKEKERAEKEAAEKEQKGEE